MRIALEWPASEFLAGESKTVKKHHVTYVLLAGLLMSFGALANHLRTYPFPGNQQGYAPEQPIAFSHKQHAGDLGISCVYCHFNASKSPHAGIPPASLCMNCHRDVTASWDAIKTEKDDAHREGRPQRRVISPELRKLYDALGLDDELKPVAGKDPQPIHWVKVHNLPEYTRFDHRAHVNAGVKCLDCHGAIETMNVTRQSSSLSMGWCVKCHKDHKEIDGKKVSPSTDCAACHY
jgi:hypothetical protein